MGFLQRLFRIKPESPAEKQALANLDAVTFEVSDEEMEKEIDREHSGRVVGPLSVMPEQEPPS